MARYRFRTLVAVMSVLSLLMAAFANFWHSYSRQRRLFYSQTDPLIALIDGYNATYSISDNYDPDPVHVARGVSTGNLPAFHYDPWETFTDIPFVVRYLRIDKTDIGVEAWENILLIKSVQRLSLWDCNLETPVPEGSHHESLSELSVGFCLVSREFLQSLGSFPKIEVLYLSPAIETDIGDSLVELGCLREVRLHNIIVSSETMKAISGLLRLKTIEISGTFHHDDIIEMFIQDDMREVSLVSTGNEKPEIVFPASSHCLTKLRLEGFRIEPATMIRIADMKSLQSLQIIDCDVNWDHFTGVEELSQLQDLRLDGFLSPVTNAEQ